MRRISLVSALATIVLCAPVSSASAQDTFGILPQAPNSVERGALIEALKAGGPALAQAFAPHVYTDAKGERMPYRLFTPARLEPGRRYPLVVFLHGAGGSPGV